MNRHELNEAVLNTYTKEQLIDVIKHMYKDNKDLERTLSMLFEDYDNVKEALDKACRQLENLSRFTEHGTILRNQEQMYHITDDQLKCWLEFKTKRLECRLNEK